MGGFFPQVVSCNSMGVGCCSSEANDKKVVTPEQQVQKTHIFCAIHAKMSFHQDRLRDKHRESTQKEIYLCVFRRTSVGRLVRSSVEPFVYKNDHFTKTGSGQTQESSKRERRFSQATPRVVAIARPLERSRGTSTPTR
jgi:hypothetical protein